MPFIPTVVSQERVSVGGIDTYANPNQFGAGVGRALQGLGGAVADLGGAVERYKAEDKKRKSQEDKLAVAGGVAMTDLGKIANEETRNAPPDGKGLADNITKKQKEFIDKYADENFTDPEQRMAYKLEMYNKLPGWRDRANADEFSLRDAHAVKQSNNSINALVNKVRSDPMQYDGALKDASGIIDAGDYSASQKETMNAELRSDIAGARFEGLMDEATSDEDFVSLQENLKDEFWQKQMTPQEYERVTSAIKVSRNAFLTGQDSQARAMLDSAETRSKANEVIPDEELQEMGGFARNAKSPSINNRYVRLLSQQRILRLYKDAPPSQIDQAIKQERQSSPEIKGVVGQWASEASRITGGEVSASYLINKLGIEYSAEDIAQGRFNVRNKAGTSSAQGLYQFVDGTWLSMMGKYGSRFGYDVSRMQKSAILALRGDPALSAKMAAMFTLENKRALQKAGINPTDTDLYLAHFLGAGGAVSFIQAMRSDPTGAVRPFGNFTQDAINANLPVFRNTKAGRGGAAKSYIEVYNNIARRMQPGVSAAKFDNIQFLEGMRDSKQKQIDADPITQFQADGKMGAYELDSAQAMTTRGADAAAAANYYNIPMSEMKPLTAQEADDIRKNIKDGDSDTQIQAFEILAELDNGAPGMMAAALAQIGEKETVLGYAASLAYDKGDTATASQIIRGNNIIKNDKTIEGAFGTAGEASSEFWNTAGGALGGMTPAMRDAIFNAAKAHYAETYASRGGQNMTFNAAQFSQSVQAVTGGTIGEVNNAKTILPQGVTEDEFETALDNMTANDLATNSVDQVPPKDIYGEPVSPSDIADEGAFVWVGKDQYKIRMADGNFLTTGELNEKASYRMNAFIFIAKPQTIKTLAGRVDRPISPEASGDIAPYDPSNALLGPAAADIVDGLQQ